MNEEHNIENNDQDNNDQENITGIEQESAPESEYYSEDSDIPAHPAVDDSSEDEQAKRIAFLEEELIHTKDKMVRAVAESENVRKRVLREREDVRKYAIADFARNLLDFSDNFRRAISSIPEEVQAESTAISEVVKGIEAMEKDLLNVFEKHSITKLLPMDEIFDPNFHEVMFESVGSGKPAGTITEIIEPGYTLHDRLLRPARVGVAKDEGQGMGDGNTTPGSNIDQQA